MRSRLFKKANNLYEWRRSQITNLFIKMGNRADTAKISLGARHLDEADVIFEGYITKYRSLIKRMEELNSDYLYVISSLENQTFFNKWLGWLPCVSFSSASVVRIKDFIEKWEAYEPGW